MFRIASIASCDGLDFIKTAPNLRICIINNVHFF